SRWVRQVNGSAGGDDVTAKLVVALDRNSESRVVVTGTSWGGSTPNYDSLTLSYPRDGSLIDLGTWRSPLSGEDRAVDMAAVDGGDVYIVGRVYNGSNYDYRTVRLNSTTGSWAAPWGDDIRYDVGYGSDYPAAIRVVPKFDGNTFDISDV